ncbi:class I SAM-dependent rRNA methyltransferase [Phaeocystidibacter marisrubri]|uniref:Class I SAM-dependent rRNA methyltransferase n=1 Tax=Phaeocystidibacter marisrubri TaxID=1577780 RepID=A0A6L3ZHV7_9FLAO|nr:class I SAM-dependent rRNA methyltransferase [Phaeocystidibacter marisrubri]KAB2817213.1 class I SAM-dependent rRNA methyltransferase [Phaeocystidibacter marisrubri]
MELKSVYLQKGRERAMERRHPWIFSGGIKKEDPVNEGDIVTVRDSTGAFLAIGHYQNPNASIRIKILSFEDVLLEYAWWENRLREAWDMRHSIPGMVNPETNAFRWVFGEGDGIPGLIIDWYNGHVVIQCHTLGIYNALDSIQRAITSIAGERLQTIYDKSGDTLHHDAIESAFLFGDTQETTILENGNSFTVNWVEGQKTGFFLDQRDNRKLVGEMSKNKKVLNAFAYSGGFSVYALNNGAREVHSVDLSKKACELADQNAALNSNATAHRSFASDVQEFLKTMDNDYDVVILDPPAFAKRKKAVHKAVQAYKRLNATAIQHMKPGTLLFTFSCSQNVSTQMFTDTIRAAAIETGRPIQILKELRQPADHPENIFFPEGHYLKGLMLRVM